MALGGVAYFRSLPAVERARLARRCTGRSLRPGEVLFEEGRPCHGLFIVANGAVEVRQTSVRGRMPSLAAKAESMPGGVRLTVTAEAPQDAGAVARIRGLGFAGLLALGAHHGPHHLAMARGEMPRHR